MRNILFLILATATVNVDFVQAGFSLGFNATNDMNSKTVNVGDTFSVDLYLFETVSTSLFTEGLLGFGTRATYDSAVIEAFNAINDASFPIVGAGPDLSVKDQIDVYGAATTPPKSSAIRLTTLSFLAKNEGSSVIYFGDYDPNISDFTLNNTPSFTDLDPSLFTSSNPSYNFTVHVTAVPEPSSILGSVGLALTYVLWIIRRRRKIQIFTKDQQSSNHETLNTAQA